MSWQKVIKEFRAEKSESNGFAASLILMYLAFGKDYPYDMAIKFKKELLPETGWTEEQLKCFSKLKDVNQLNVLLNGMENRGLLKSRKEDKGRRRKYFQLNEDIIISPFTNEGLDKMIRDIAKSNGSTDNEAKDRDLVLGFLDELSKRCRDIYFGRWSSIEKFDYLTVLGCLKQEALDMKNEAILILLNDNIHSIIELEKRTMKIKSNSEINHEIRLENKARHIKDELNPVDRILDKFEENTK
jgi:hypothetical protein